jgi:glutamyl-tRNA reductase
MLPITVGVNHQTAPIGVRERLAFTPSTLAFALDDLIKKRIASEAVIVSTCNRTEIYARAEKEALIQWLGTFHRVDIQEFRPFLYTFSTAETIRHAFRVASGLDSMILGEPQILGQFKNAVSTARQTESLGPFLNALFQKTFSTAKEIRTNTDVGKNATSMATIAVKMAEQIFPDIRKLNILLVGAGEMMELVATHFAAQKPQHIAVVNRTIDRAEELCRMLDTHTQAHTLSELPHIIAQYDVLVSSTASPLPIIGKGVIEKALKHRRNIPIFLLDLAVPRDIEPEVEELSDAFLYTIDNIADLVAHNQQTRKSAAVKAEQIIDEKVAEFLSWQENRKQVPFIKTLRVQNENLRQKALARAKKQLQKGVATSTILEELSIQLTNKLAHPALYTLNHASDHPDLAEAIIKINKLQSK